MSIYEAFSIDKTVLYVFFPFKTTFVLSSPEILIRAEDKPLCIIMDGSLYTPDKSFIVSPGKARSRAYCKVFSGEALVPLLLSSIPLGDTYITLGSPTVLTEYTEDIEPCFGVI